MQGRLKKGGYSYRIVQNDLAFNWVFLVKSRVCEIGYCLRDKPTGKPSLQSACNNQTSAIQCLVDSDCSMHPRHPGCLSPRCTLDTRWLELTRRLQTRCTRCAPRFNPGAGEVQTLCKGSYFLPIVKKCPARAHAV